MSQGSDKQSIENHRTIVFAIGGLVVGGAEQLVIELANRFASEGWQSHVLCLDKAGLLADGLSDQVKLTVLGKKSGVDFSLPKRIRKFIDEVKPDVINSHLWTSNLWMRIALKNTYVPMVITEHNRDVWKKPHHKFIDRLLQGRTNKLIAVSNDTGNFYQKNVGIKKDLITVIYNGVNVEKYSTGTGFDLKAELGLMEDIKLIAMVGRLVEQKNYYRLIDAAALLSQKNKKFACVIVGDGPLKASLQDYCREKNMDTFVKFLGVRKDVPNILQSVDMFTLSSDREGHPLTAMEAQAAALPVVLTDVGGSIDALANDGTQQAGLMVEADAQALADGWQHVLEDDNEFARMSAFAKEYAMKEFSLDRMYSDYKNCFVSLINQYQKAH